MMKVLEALALSILSVLEAGSDVLLKNKGWRAQEWACKLSVV